MTERTGTMDAAVYRTPGTMTVDPIPVPEVGDHDVLIEVSHCGICGSDLHFVLEGWSAPDQVHGHEFSGRIAALGRDVRGWALGDEVVGGEEARCGTCPMCLAGRPSLCSDRDTPGTGEHQGAFTRYVKVDQRQLHRIPDGLSLRAAALTEPMAIALHAITVSKVPAGATVMVFGAGPIGALILAALVARDGADVRVVEPNDMRRALADKLGASSVCLPDDLDVPTIAEPGRIVDGAVDVVFECSGRRAAMEAGLGQLRRGGTLVLVGAGMDPPRFDPNRILLNELVVTGSFNYDQDGFETALALLASGRLPLDDLIDPTDVGLDRIVDAMHGLVNGTIAGKVLVDPRLPTH